MPSYSKATDELLDIASDLINEHYREPVGYGLPLADCVRRGSIDGTQRLQIDYMFASGDRDPETGMVKSYALKKNGLRALGITRKISLRDRSKGMGDVEICIDKDWWDDEADEQQKRALVDHELYHIIVTDHTDDLGRPVIKLRKHDFEFGWFAAIANRHGEHSQERIQAKTIMDRAGQYFWPVILPEAQKSQRSMVVEKVRLNPEISAAIMQGATDQFNAEMAAKGIEAKATVVP